MISGLTYDQQLCILLAKARGFYLSAPRVIESTEVLKEHVKRLREKAA